MFCPADLECYSALWCSAADTHLILLDSAVSGARFLTGGVFECDIVHRQSVVVLFVLRIRCNTVYPHNGALPGLYCQCRLLAVLWSHIGALMRILAAEPRSTAGILFHSQCSSGTILLTPYSMVWDWLVSRAGPMLSYWHKLHYPYYGILLSLSLLSVYSLVL